MWPFRKKASTLLESGIFGGLTDWHSHILPGVDDGVQTLEHSLEVLRQYEDWGVSEVWLTPHIMEDYPNTPESLRERYKVLTDAYSGPIRLNLAAEHMLDALFEERIAENRVMPIGEGNDHILVETSYFNPPMDFDELIESVFAKGYFPLLAHPERYRYMDYERYEQLRDRGLKFQMNFNSLVGGYGSQAQEKAEWLLRHDMIDVIGSDLHRLSSVVKLSDMRARKQEWIDRLVDVARNPRL